MLHILQLAVFSCGRGDKASRTLSQCLSGPVTVLLSGWKPSSSTGTPKLASFAS